MYAIEYSKQERAAQAAIAIVLHLALVYVFAVGIGVVPVSTSPPDLKWVDVPEEKSKPLPIETPPEVSTSTTNVLRTLVPEHEPIIKIQDESYPPVDFTEVPIEPSHKTVIEEPVVAVTGAKIVRSSEPTYPLVSRAREEEGTVVVKVMISPYGTVGDAQIEKSSGFSRLDAAAIKAVRGWEFSAGKRGSQPIATWVTVSVKFVLNGR